MRSVEKSTLSAREAARRLGFATPNPILAAIERNELPAERRTGKVRNGHETRAWAIRPEHLETWRLSQHIERPSSGQDAPAAVLDERQDAPETRQDAPETPETFNVADAILRPGGIPGGVPGRPVERPEVMVSIPLRLLLELHARAVRAETDLAYERGDQHRAESEHIEQIYGHLNGLERELGHRLELVERGLASMRTIVGKRVAAEKRAKSGD
jgi:hypothetical protein